MKYIGFDLGDGESAVAAFEHGSGIEPVILPVCGAKSLLSAVGMLNGEIVLGERAYTDALADGLSVRFKSRFTTDIASGADLSRFVRGVLMELTASGQLSPADRFVVGCPAGWNAACRARYRDLLVSAGMPQPQVISESRAAFLYAKYARTVALDVDILNESALVADIGSSTLDFAYIVDGRETGVGTFGETALGGGILDAALLRHSVERCRDKEAIRAVFDESRSWYSYCEIEARRVKEEYYTRLTTESSPVVQKQLRICYDGMQKLPIRLDEEEANRLVYEPLKELNGHTFAEAVRQALEEARRITADRPPRLLLLTGGASRMPFFREECRQVFQNAVVVCCPEPEFSIAKGLAYAGWIDENLQAFRQAVQETFSTEHISTLVQEALPSLLPNVADALTRLILEEAAIPLAHQWKEGRIATLEDMNQQIAARVERVLASPLAQEALAPAVRQWLKEMTIRLQGMVDPICDRFEVPRKQMKLDLLADCAGDVHLPSDQWMDFSILGTVLGVLLSVISALLCGGTGIALIASGPLGLLAGLLIGAAASLLGWPALSEVLNRAELPVLLRRVNVEKRLNSPEVQSHLRQSILKELSAPGSPFQQQMADDFSNAFRDYVLSIAQAAEIPIA